EKVSSPLSAQILEFYESELFPETLQNLEVASTSNCCYEDHHHHQSYSSYTTTTTNLSFPAPIDDINATKPPLVDTNSFSIIFEDDNDINLDFTSTNHYQFGHQDQFDLALLQLPLATDLPYPHPSDHVVPVMGPAAACDQHDCLSSMPPSKFMRFNNPSSPANFSFMDPSINSYNYLSGNSNPPLPAAVESPSGIFNGNNLFLGNIEIQPHELDFKGDIFCPDSLPPPYNSNELEALSNESQHHLVNEGGSCATPLALEITSLEAETLRVANKLSTQERKEKIHRYMKKRNERNFSKKIKYACRKTLADSRPRVRGRFAKNEEFGENNRTTCSNHEEDTDEDVKSIHVVVKEEEDNLESSEMFAHIQSWI
ncbi:CCT domain-containing protein, partial [Cynara cardunculus var. scolymus]